MHRLSDFQKVSIESEEKDKVLIPERELDLPTFLQRVRDSRKDITSQIKVQNLKNLPNELEKLLHFAFQTKSPSLLAKTLAHCGNLSLKLQYFKYSAYFYEQAFIITQFYFNDLLRTRLNCLVGLAYLARDTKQYESCEKLYKKALEYAWYLQEKKVEIEIYEQMGINYYYLGRIQKSKYFHDRSVNDLHEKDDSSTKVLSNGIIKARAEEKSYWPREISKALLNYLNLPFFQK